MMALEKEYSVFLKKIVSPKSQKKRDFCLMFWCYKK